MKGSFLKETLVLYMCQLGSETLKSAFLIKALWNGSRGSAVAVFPRFKASPGASLTPYQLFSIPDFRVAKSTFLIKVVRDGSIE